MENIETGTGRFAIVRDENGRDYYFNHLKYSEKFKEYARNRGVSKKSLREELGRYANTSEDSLKKYEVDIQVKSKKDKNKFRRPSDPEVCKKLGEFLCNDKYAFLVPCISLNNLKFENKKYFLNEVFADLHGILSLYTSSDCFNKLPHSDLYEKVPEKTDNKEMAYFDMCIDETEHKIDSCLLFESECTGLKKRLKKITSQTREFIHLYEQPGVVDEWAEANPKIRYYDPGFQLACYEPAAYRFVSESQHMKFRFTPENEEEIVKCRKYFASLEEENEKYNLRYTQEQFFQKELLETLTAVFRKNFSEYIE